MEPICLCGLIRTWRDEAGDPWREMLGAEHVPGIRGPQSVLLNSRLGLCKPCKHILKDTRLQHKHVHFNRSTWKIWAQKANMRRNAECGSKWILTIDQDQNQLFVYMHWNQNHELSESAQISEPSGPFHYLSLHNWVTWLEDEQVCQIYSDMAH